MLQPVVVDARDLVAVPPVVVELNQELDSAKGGSSTARQRLAIRRVIRDAEKTLQTNTEISTRFQLLEFLFRARQQLVELDNDPRYRQALLETSRELVKAPDEFADLRLEADLLLSQVELAQKGAGVGEKSDALRLLVDRYLKTTAGKKVLRMTLVMALEFGDTRLVNDLRAIIAEHFGKDHEMIIFQRDLLGGQVFGVPFVGHFKRSDGKTVCYPMDGLGHSTMALFWSKDDLRALRYLADLAAAAKTEEGQGRLDGRLEIISFNLDELPDAGESIIRQLGVDWQVLYLPGGRKNPFYKAYARVDLTNLRVAPTGQAAMSMRESRPKPPPPSEEEILEALQPSPDYKNQLESFRRTLIRSWSRDDYALNLGALMTGDFLIFDPDGEMDPARPPELKAAARGGEVTPLERGDGSVPEAMLLAIQACLIPPPQRYHSTMPEIRASYQKMVKLCRQAIAEHPDAPDLWIVRNRLIIGLLGLWKTDFDLAHFEAAVEEAKIAMEAGFPSGTDVIARFCLARQSLRDPKAEAGVIIDAFVAGYGGETASGPALAVAALLALDVADKARFEKYRAAIIKDHTEYPMMWIFSSFLLDRYHEYWLFHVPFNAGWSFGRRLSYDMAQGPVEDARRMLKVELPTMDGDVFRIPEDLEAECTAIFFAQPGPWKVPHDREDERPFSPGRMMGRFPTFAVSRPDVDVMVAMLAKGDAEAIRDSIPIHRSVEKYESPILEVPGGLSHPIIYRLGFMSPDQAVVMVNKQGRILTARSGLSFDKVQNALEDTVYRQDEKKVMEALDRGDIQDAKDQIMELAPPYDPEAVDERGRKLKKPKYSLPHLHARTHVYMALEQWEAALVDAEEIVRMSLRKASGMSIRTDELDEAEILRDSILEQVDANDTLGQAQR